MNPRLAVIGATGAVGSRVCRLLADHPFAFASLRVFGRPGGPHRHIPFQGQSLPVEPLEPERLADGDLAISSTPDDAAPQIAQWITGQGGIVIDESAAHRMREDVPLIVPEVNASEVASHRGILASPNCSTIQLVVCLAPLARLAPLKRVTVATYQAASGAGEAARQELCRGLSSPESNPASAVAFGAPLPNNLIPRIGRCVGEATSEEVKMVVESRKILGRPTLKMIATCVRVPIEYCHGEAVTVEFEQPVPPERAREALQAAPGVKVLDDPQRFCLPMPRGAVDGDDVQVGRIRRDESVEHGLAFWCVADNLRKGAATNAVQIAAIIARENA